MKPQRGMFMFELAITVAILGVLAAALIVRLDGMEEEAERLEVRLTVRNIRVGIQLAVGERIMRGEEDRLAELAKGSPMDFLGHLPRGFMEGRSEELTGQWVYDSSQRELSYYPRRPSAFNDARVLRWRFVERADSTGRVFGVGLVELN